MNNNLLFLALGGVGLYMLTKTKTSAPVVPTGATSYVPAGGYTTPPIQPFTPSDIIKTTTGIVNDATDLWGAVKGAATSIKTSVPQSVPTSVPSSIPSTTPVFVQENSAMAPYTTDYSPSVAQGITYGEPYVDGGIVRDNYFDPTQF